MTHGLLPIATFLTTLAALTAPAAGVIKTPIASADGLPVMGLGVGNDGVENLSGSERFVALKAGKNSVIARVKQDSGEVLSSRFLRGNLTIPAVTYDGSAAGLSANGEVLAVIEPRARFPRRSTTLALYDAQRARFRERIVLDGDFSFDAISPDGSLLYLVEYPNPRNPSVYRVRMYDVAAKRLLRKPLIDSRLAAVVMRGLPMNRENSPDGAVAYTLYDGAGNGPFIHALDTAERSALCILLPMVNPKADPWQMKLDVSDDGGELAVLSKRRPVAVVDTETAKARRPGESVASTESSGLGVGGGLLAALALVAAGAGWGLTRRARRA